MLYLLIKTIMGKFILSEEEKTKIRGMYGMLNEDDSCEGLCQFMYEGSCVPISVAIKTQRATNEWYKQKKVQHPEYFNLNRDERLKEKYDEYTKNMLSDDQIGRFWVGVANMECRGPEDFEYYLNACRKPKIVA
jgi:hypothetical protein